MSWRSEGLGLAMAPELWPSTALLAAYLLGSIPFALLLGLSLGVDIRQLGSKNVGATNLSRACGRKWGIVAFSLDFSKGLVPVLVAPWLESKTGTGQLWKEGSPAIFLGLAAIVGHVFPIYLGFRGGKGVATTFGVMAGLSWLSTLLVGAVWLGFYLTTRTVSIASSVSVLALPIVVFIIERNRPSGFGLLLGFTAGVSLLLILRHRSNLARLLRGEEHRFGVSRPGSRGHE